MTAEAKRIVEEQRERNDETMVGMGTQLALVYSSFNHQYVPSCLPVCNRNSPVVIL